MDVLEVAPPQFIKITFSSESKVPQYVALSKDGLLKAGLREELFKRKDNDPIEGYVTKKLKEFKSTYTRLRDVIPDTEDNVFGVVSWFEPPMPTKGDDWLTKAQLVDPSCADSDLSLKLLLFHEREMAPPIRRVGDILRCHRIKINKFETLLQGIGNKRSTSCVVFDGQVGDPVTIRVATADKRNHSLSKSDCEVVESLRKWYSERPQANRSGGDLTIGGSVSGGGGGGGGGNVMGGSMGGATAQLVSPSQMVALGGSHGVSQEIKDISSLGYNTGYFCLVCQIVKITYSAEKYVAIKVTDYTDNDHVE